MYLTEQWTKIIEPKTNEQAVSLVKEIEFAARNCYASHDKITDNSYEKFIKGLIKRGHEAPLEFADITFDIITSRAVLAEITRHRLASFCVESQRYIMEANEEGHIEFIIPEWYKLGDNLSSMWTDTMEDIEDTYIEMIKNGAQPQQAREILPNSTACRIIMKANIREWRHFFNLRCSKAAYPQMRQLALKMLEEAHELFPIVFDDIYEKMKEGM